MKNEKWVLKQRPNGRPNIETDFEKTSEDLQEINFGEILIETQYLSLDPYLCIKRRFLFLQKTIEKN